MSKAGKKERRVKSKEEGNKNGGRKGERSKKLNGSGKIRYAVVGLGHIAQAAILPAFKKKIDNSELTALVSGSDKKLKKLGKQYKVSKTCDYSEYEELLDSGEIDAVFIALPNTMHFHYSKVALERGIHVLCEKPLCPTVNECEELIHISKESGAKLMTAYRLHFDPLNLKVVELIEKGEIGDPVIFSSLFSYQVKEGNVRLERDQAGGAHYDIGVYCVNAARYIFRDEPEAVFGNLIMKQDRRFKEVDGTVNATLLFPQGKSAQFTASFAAYERSLYEIVGTEGSIRVEPAYEYTEGLSFTIENKKGKRVHRQKKHDQFAPEINYFSDCILNDKPVETDGEEGLADVRILEAIQQSSRSGKVIELRDFETDYPHPRMAQKFRPHGRPRDLIDVESASIN